MNTPLPKVILHEHIEGSVTPETALVLAKKHNVSLPDDFLYPEGAYDKDAFPNGRYQYDETDFGAFVTAYDVVADLVRDADDYYLIMKDYLLRNAQQGMIYCEMITSAFHLCYQEDAQGKVLLNADKYHDFMDAIERAINEVKEEYGTETRLQACGVRHLSLEHLDLVLISSQKTHEKWSRVLILRVMKWRVSLKISFMYMNWLIISHCLNLTMQVKSVALKVSEMH